MSVYSENVRLVASIDSPIFGEVMNVCARNLSSSLQLVLIAALAQLGRRYDGRLDPHDEAGGRARQARRRGESSSFPFSALIADFLDLQTGYFAFGGSTIVVLFKPNTVQFDADLLNNSKNSVRPPRATLGCLCQPFPLQIETLIRVGTRIGRAVGK